MDGRAEGKTHARRTHAHSLSLSPPPLLLSLVEFPNASYGTRPAGNIGKLLFDFCDTVQVGQTTTFAAQGLCP